MRRFDRAYQFGTYRGTFFYKSDIKTSSLYDIDELKILFLRKNIKWKDHCGSGP